MPLPRYGCFRLVIPLCVLADRRDLPKPSRLLTSSAGGRDSIEYIAEPAPLIFQAQLDQNILSDLYRLKLPAVSHDVKFLPV